MARRRLTESIEIDAPPAVVWALIANLAAWPIWTPTVDAVDLLDPPPAHAGEIHVGQRARLRQPGTRPATWTVSAVQPGRSFVWGMRALGLRVDAGHCISPTGDGCRLELSVEISGPTAGLLGWMVTRKSRRFLPREALAAKAAAESI